MKINRESVSKSTVGFLVFILCVYFISELCININFQSKKLLELDSGWNIRINHQETKDVTLSQFTFPAVGKGDKIEMTYHLASIDVKNPLIQFETYHSIVRVYIENRLIYESGEQYYQEHKLVGNGMYCIDLPDDCKGKVLRIQMDVTEENAYSNIRPFRLMNSDQALEIYISENVLTVAIAMFVLILGLIISVMTVRTHFRIEHHSLVSIGLASILISCWTLCSYRLTQLVVGSVSVATYLEYLTLYSSVVPFVVYVRNEVRNKRAKQLMTICGYIHSMFFVTAVILEISHIASLPSVLPVFHMLIIVTGIALSYACIQTYRYHQLEADPYLLRGVIIICAFLIIDVLRFNIQKYCRMLGVFMEHSIMPLGILIFILCILFRYFCQYIIYASEKVEQKILYQTAYTDSMTGIANRRKCEELLNKLDKSINFDVYCINFDMNNLKTINDHYGHRCGDEVICRFATILNEELGNIGLVGRMGGDEFIAIIENIDESLFNQQLNEMLLRIQQENESRMEQVKISVAYGVAYSKDYPGLSIWKLYEQADSVMYECKVKMKKEERTYS